MALSITSIHTKLYPQPHPGYLCAGIELLMLARAIPGERQVIGIDLAQGMVDVAHARIDASSDTLLRWASTIVSVAHVFSTLPNLRSQSSTIAIASDFHSVIVAAKKYTLTCRQRVTACAGDACKLAASDPPPALVFSCFGLQQMPEPQEVQQNQPSTYAALPASHAQGLQ